jgi:shikimate dehydrogenase
VSIPYAEVIGDPIAHSKSPLIHNFWLGKLGIAGEYRKVHVRPDELRAYFRERRADSAWRGCNVTIPHKQAILPLLDSVDAEVVEIGAANCVFPGPAGLTAANTDIEGIYEALPAFRMGTSACLIGAGGAARAALVALKRLGASRVNIVARNEGAGRDLLRDFRMAGDIHGFEGAAIAVGGAAALINSSPLGMTGSPPMPDSVLSAVEALRDDACVFDMVYAPLRTELLQAAREAKRIDADGLTMLIGQAATAFELFFGQPAPREHDAELRALLTA